MKRGGGRKVGSSHGIHKKFSFCFCEVGAGRGGK
jgi:hypothetical protein